MIRPSSRANPPASDYYVVRPTDPALRSSLMPKENFWSFRTVADYVVDLRLGLRQCVLPKNADPWRWRRKKAEPADHVFHFFTFYYSPDHGRFRSP